MILPRLVLTTGDPAGIGPDLCLQIAHRQLPCGLVVAGDPKLLGQRASQLGLKVELALWKPSDDTTHQADRLRVWPVATAAETTPGKLTAANAAYVLKTISESAQACLSGNFNAMVTAPINKASINEAGTSFSGHTEFIASLTGGDPVMLLTAPGLRVALATTHIPLTQVSQNITRERLIRILRTLDKELKQHFGIASPRILVAGLNPHAGECGHLGQEEIEIISPVLETLRQEGLNLIGPLPADTLFLPPVLAGSDAVLAMYHDQGLPVLKHLGFGRAVNITLGLPIIRTSVDHGTALELAGTGKADPGSLLAAIDAAIDLVHHAQPL